MNMDGKCIIIGAGELFVSEIPVDREDYVIAADGGLCHCGRLKIDPDLMIGDFDSVSEQEAEAVARRKQQVPDRIICLPTEKDDTDMLAAMKEGLRRGYTDFWIYGGTGGRLDHTLANIQCLLYLKNRGAKGQIFDRNGKISVIKNETIHFPGNQEGYLSLFSLTKESKGVTIRGMKYLLKNAELHNDFPVGISNEFIGRAASVTVEDGEVVCILQCP